MKTKFDAEPVMEEEQEEVQFKKYVIIDAVKSTAQIYLGDKDNDKAFRFDTPRSVPLYLRHSFSDKKGIRKVSRYKLGSNSIWQSEQIKEDSIPANEPFTSEEKNALKIINGVLVTDDAYTQAFLSESNNPQRADFTGTNRGGVTPLFIELDEDKVEEDENELIFKTGDALTKIKSMNMDECAAFISMIFGASQPLPEKLRGRQNMLANSLQNSIERINVILEGNIGKDDEITILLSKVLHDNILTFDIKQDYVSIMKEGQWVDFKMLTGDSYEQREILLRQYLASSEGELHRKELESLVAEHGDNKEEKIAGKRGRPKNNN